MMRPKLGIRAAALVYAVACVTLVCNDWWLKGAAILPGWLTGKLSDVAGLVVAFVTASLFLGHRAPRVGQLACAAITLVFVLVKMDAACTELLVKALASVGLTWSVRTDPTDLLALGIIPLAWTSARVLTRSMQQSGGTRLALRAAAIPAALACLASGVPDKFNANGYVYNDSGKTVFVEIASIPGVDCSTTAMFGTDWLEEGDFQSIGLFQVGPREVVPLRGAYGQTSAGCLYRISFEGRRVAVLTPENYAALEKSPPSEEVRKARPNLIFARPGAELLVGSGFQVLDVPPTAPASKCADEPPAMTFSTRVTQLKNARLVALQPVAGQCLELEFSTDTPSSAGGGAGGGGGAASDETPAPGGAAGAAGMAGAGAFGDDRRGERIHVCAPRELLPFSVGDVINLATRTGTNFYGSNVAWHQLELVEQSGAKGFRLEIGAPGDLVTEGPNYSPNVRMPDSPCGPNRDDDRRLWLPLGASVYARASGLLERSWSASLSPGATGQVTVGDGTNVTVYLGRGRRYFSGEAYQWIEVVESWSR